MLAARHFRVVGRVQGVGFRFFVQEAAAVEGLAGWVRNLADGSVEVLAEGDRDALARFERQLWRGPSRARVEEISVQDRQPSSHHRGFEIQA